MIAIPDCKIEDWLFIEEFLKLYGLFLYKDNRVNIDHKQIVSTLKANCENRDPNKTSLAATTKTGTLIS